MLFLQDVPGNLVPGSRALWRSGWTGGGRGVDGGVWIGGGQGWIKVNFLI